MFKLEKNSIDTIVINTVLFASTLVVVNLIFTKLFFRIDLTKNKLYTLSDSTKNVLNSLDDEIRVKAYFSSNLPPYLLGVRRNIRGLLREYQAYSAGRLKLEFYDPDASENAVKSAARLGISKAQMSVVSDDKMEVRGVYLSIAILYANQKEIINVVRGASNIEYKITSAIKKIMTEKVIKVAFISDNESQSIDTDLNIIAKQLRENYSVSSLPLLEAQKKLEEYDVIILPGPKESLYPRMVFELDQLIMRGKSVILLLDSIMLKRNFLGAIPVKSGTLSKALAYYGIRAANNLVIDKECAVTRFSGGEAPYPLEYLYWPKLTKENFWKDSPVLSMLDYIVFPWTMQVEAEKKFDKGTDFDLILSSSKRSWTLRPPYNLSPLHRFSINPDNARSYGLACVLRGKLKSFFAGKAIPQPEVHDKTRRVAFEIDDKHRVSIDSTNNAKLAVIGNSMFINNRFIKLYPSNGIFFRNLVEYMASDKELISIRSRQQTSIPIPTLTDKEKIQIRWTNILCSPILVIILGFIHFYFRKKEKEIYQSSISS